MTAWADVGTARRALPGELECGDDFVLVRGDDAVLIAVIDGLGHGETAAEAAAVAVACVAANAAQTVPVVIERCHQAMRRTRGAVMTLARLERSADGVQLTWAGVGNVEGVHLRADGTRDRVLALGGIVGYSIARVLTRTVAVGRGDTVALATDGVRSDFVDALGGDGPAQEVADRVLAAYGRPTDDACVVVVRVVGDA